MSNRGASKEPKNPFPELVDYSVRLMHHDPNDLGLICLVKKKRKVRFRIISDSNNR